MHLREQRQHTNANTSFRTRYGSVREEAKRHLTLLERFDHILVHLKLNEGDYIVVKETELNGMIPSAIDQINEIVNKRI